MPRVSQAVFSIPLTALLVSADRNVSALMRTYAAMQTTQMGRMFRGDLVPSASEIDRFLAWVDSVIGSIFGSNAADVEKLYDVRGSYPNLVKQSVARAAKAGAEPIISRTQKELQILGIDMNSPSPVRGLRAPNPILSTKEYVDPNGFKLSTRVWKAGDEIAKQIDTIVRYELERGASPTRLAKQLEQFLTAEGASSRTTKLAGREGRVGSYSARRLVRTETSRAHGNAVIAAARVDPFTAGIKWNLGFSHPGLDACDGNAQANNYGYGAGIYPPDRIPTYPNHPHCLCYLSSVDAKNRERIRDGVKNNFVDLSGIDTNAVIKETTGFDVSEIAEKSKPVTPVIAKAAVPKTPVTPVTSKDAASISNEQKWREYLAKKNVHDPIAVPATTIEEAQSFAQRLGFKNVTLAKGTSVETMNHANAGLYQMRIKGYAMPENLRAESTGFGKDTVAEYEFHTRTLRINNAAKFWKNPTEFQRTQFNSNFWANSDPNDVIFHEMGHKLHNDQIGLPKMLQLQRGVPPSKNPLMTAAARKEMSAYGMTDPLEFVAEVFSGHISGRKWSADILRVYKSYNGPVLP